MGRWGLNNLQVIVFNYLTCVLTGSLVIGYLPLADSWQQPWFPYACLMGLLFISIFNLIAFTAQRLGVAVASVATKLSLVIPFLLSLYLYQEAGSLLKYLGVGLALLAVVLTCWPSSKGADRKKNQSAWLLFTPVILFIGTGILDSLIKYTEHHFLSDSNKNEFLITAFAAAAAIGLLLLLLQWILHRKPVSGKAILAGAAIGFPNYFSIWCLVQVLQLFTGNSSAIIPVNNMGIVLFSTVIAWLLFKEKLSSLNWVGVWLSTGAIALIAFG